MGTGAKSPFLTPPTLTRPGSLAFLHLRRDDLVSTVLRDSDADNSGYAEGAVATTRFGSYPHSTLLGIPFGSQVLASQVDTGSRGRKPTDRGSKRKRESTDAPTDSPDPDAATLKVKQTPLKTAVRAASGFCHVIPPTPEVWTQALPHRTQVVYTPDYSFIIQRLRVRPGSKVIEAGAGSGSFTHAAVRAAFNGYPERTDADPSSKGHVFSFEYHAPRAATLHAELKQHGLGDIVTVTHRDVYQDGFSLSETPVRAQHVFLDLPAPWTAIPHLSRTASPCALDPERPVYLCAFIPCIEQAQRTAGSLRVHGWVEVNMQEMAHRRLEVRRERVGLAYEGLRGVNAVAGSVDEALDRLRLVEERARGRRAGQISGVVRREHEREDGADDETIEKAERPALADRSAVTESKAQRLSRIAREAEAKKPWREGRVVCRTEPEIKTHTSYLVFATLPRMWTEEDEQRARDQWGDPTAKKKSSKA